MRRGVDYRIIERWSESSSIFMGHCTTFRLLYILGRIKHKLFNYTKELVCVLPISAMKYYTFLVAASQLHLNKY